MRCGETSRWAKSRDRVLATLAERLDGELACTFAPMHAKHPARPPEGRAGAVRERCYGWRSLTWVQTYVPRDFDQRVKRASCVIVEVKRIESHLAQLGLLR